MTDLPPQPSSQQRRGRWVAIVTGAISVLVGVLYLLLIVVLDSRGPLQPPPPEALGAAPARIGTPPLSAPQDGAAAGDPAAATVPPHG
ncbi:hypothetical protein [Cyanobium sp. CH-040]|uniref:hypothetical protein n=1 Tax=Cyanobium sp. CH-040 TaxID=2823708 RepID=UPI0020CC7E06|nr:hypothetical protein [Cyanobium sp. CH-040]MCP9926898.1 hypothetical protein [Cyanobium sp. CH-040]